MKARNISSSLAGVGALLLSASSSHAAPEVIGMRGTMPELGSVQIENANVYDYTFASAPTDWRVQSGVWEMTNRWSCSPGWSWFGGRSEEVASVWNKRKFSGDVSIHMYFAFKMGLAGTPSWNYHPSDVAISFHGDGKNLSSGYTFIVGADNNSRSMLMKGDKTVAESNDPKALLPALTDGNPEMNELHRHWWYLKVNKIGPRVECWLDNKLLFSYIDPKPLDAGQIAMWTYNNGIMLSRVQVFYENEVRSAPTWKPLGTSPLITVKSNAPRAGAKSTLKKAAAPVKKSTERARVAQSDARPVR
jgi:hypothetical protein